MMQCAKHPSYRHKTHASYHDSVEKQRSRSEIAATAQDLFSYLRTDIVAALDVHVDHLLLGDLRADLLALDEALGQRLLHGGRHEAVAAAVDVAVRIVAAQRMGELSLSCS